MTDLARTFVSFSSTDKPRYHMMEAWKAHEHIDFNFANFQLDEAVKSNDPHYIKKVCRNKVRKVDSFVLLIGPDTYTKTVFVKDEVQVAIEKGCHLIGVNLNDCRFKDARCPNFFANRGAIFIPFSSRIMKKALTWERRADDDWSYKDHVYTDLGYELVGNTAVLPPPPNLFAGGNRPRWAK
jgi:hypothetical protein